MLFVNKQKSRNLYRQLGLQLPQGFYKLGFDNIIRKSSAVVNTHSMQGGENYSQNALLQGKKFTGDAMTPEARARWMGAAAEGKQSPSHGDAVTAPFTQGGRAADAANVPMSEAQVVERALQLTAEGKRKATAADFDGILQELGDDPPPLRTLGRFFRKFLLDCQKLYKYTAKKYIYHTYFPTLFARRL